MKDTIFIRYFELKTDQIPMDSNPIVRLDNPLVSREINDYMCGMYISDWLTRYPNGKVDFVVL
jgi:hypothetical protein